MELKVGSFDRFSSGFLGFGDCYGAEFGLHFLLGEAAVDAVKSVAVGAGLNGRVKKKHVKQAKSGSKVPWGKLISQYSQVCFGL